MSEILYQDTLPGGAHWSLELRRGTKLTLIDRDGGANVSMLFYNPRNLLERYNAPDTLKCQHTFKLTKGHCLYSDMGRIFCSIVEDSVGWHDTVGGNLTESVLEERWGKKNYQTYHNDWTLSGQNSFLVELAKYGMTRRDMAANLNLFSKVQTDAEGNMKYVVDNSQTGDSISLRFEMDTLVIFHTCPHPLNPAKSYPKKSVTYQLSVAEPIEKDDICINSRPENQRGFKNNQLYHLGCESHGQGER